MKPAALLALLPLLTGCPSIRSPEDRVKDALADLSRQGLQETLPGGGKVDVPPGSLRLTDTSFGPADRGRIPVFAQLSVEGRMDGTPFSYLGTETLGFACDRACRMEEGPRRLFAILAALRARRAALARGGAGLEALSTGAMGASQEQIAAASERSVAAWFIRVDRQDAVVGEADPSGVQHRLTLRQEGESFRFIAGLP